MNEPDLKLPALIDRARQFLAEARTSAEVLEARAAAQAAFHQAKLVKAANETKADCLAMIARAEIRMADEIDAAQAGGEVVDHGGARKFKVPAPDLEPATFADLNLDRRRVAEWRQLRDAGGERIIETAIQGALAENRAPTMSDIRNEVSNVIFVRRSEPDPSEKTPTRIIFSSIIKRLTPEEVQRDAIWRLTQSMLAQVNAQPNPVKAAAAVPEDRKAWVRHEVARQIVWFHQFIDALTDGLPEAPPGDHAPIEGGADQR